MQMPSEFIFLRPWWLLLIPVGILLAYAAARTGRDNWRQVCDRALLPELTVIGDRVSTRLVWFLVLIGWLLATIALAGPAWERHQSARYDRVDAMVIVFDLSRSMGSSDIQPSRLERARYKALEVVEALQGKSVGLVAFAGDAFDVAPISDDIGTIVHLLQSLQIRMMPVQGSQASLGLRKAQQLLENSEHQRGSIVLLTDGVDESASSAAIDLREKGYRLSVIAVGTQAGSPINLEDGDFLKNAAGEFVVSPVDYGALAELAELGGGLFSLVSEPFSESILQSIHFGDGSLQLAEEDRFRADWNDHGPWFLLALLPLVALCFRRGWILALIVLLPLGAQEARALEWQDLWQRADQRAAAAVQRQDYDDTRLRDHPEWNGIALYRQDKFEEAALAFSYADDQFAKFNTGNALARSGNLQSAIEQYEAALQIDPEFEDAKFNLDLVRKALRQQPRQSARGDSSNDSEDRSDGDVQQAAEPERMAPDGERSESGEGDQKDEPRDEDNQLARSESDAEAEQKQLMEQWLRVIPDDPAGLLRRRFYYEYRERDPVQRQSTVAW